MTPERRARQEIDTKLVAAGWIVQDYKAFNPSAGRGIAEQTRIMAEVERRLSVMEELEPVVSGRVGGPSPSGSDHQP